MSAVTQALDRPSYTSGMLLATAEHVPRVISGTKSKQLKSPPLAVHPIYEQRYGASGRSLLTLAACA